MFPMIGFRICRCVASWISSHPKLIGVFTGCFAKTCCTTSCACACVECVCIFSSSFNSAITEARIGKFDGYNVHSRMTSHAVFGTDLHHLWEKGYITLEVEKNYQAFFSDTISTLCHQKKKTRISVELQKCSDQLHRQFHFSLGVCDTFDQVSDKQKRILRHPTWHALLPVLIKCWRKAHCVTSCLGISTCFHPVEPIYQL